VEFEGDYFLVEFNFGKRTYGNMDDFMGEIGVLSRTMLLGAERKTVSLGSLLRLHCNDKFAQSGWHCESLTLVSIIANLHLGVGYVIRLSQIAYDW